MGVIDHIEQAIDMMNSNSESDDDSIDKDYLAPVHLMTALRVKGKQNETVILLEVKDGIWPNKLLTTEIELEQERRVFYVAVTRPKK